MQRIQPLVLWRIYSAALLLAAIAGISWALRLDPQSFWQLTWTSVIWIAVSAMGLILPAPRQRDPIWWMALGCSIVAVAMWTIMVLCEVIPDSEALRKTVWISLSFFVISGMYLCALLLLRHAPRGGRLSKLGRIALRAAITWLAVVYMIFVIASHVSDSLDSDDFFLPIALPIILMTVLVLWFPAAASLDALVVVETLPRQATLLAHCPSCGKQQKFVQGGARCSGCGLVVMIEFQEPRCECGYLLYNLPSGVCPECGRNVRAPGATALSENTA